MAAFAVAAMVAGPWAAAVGESAESSGPETRNTCADCHGTVAAQWRQSGHARAVSESGDDAAAGVSVAADCRDCHGPGDRHEARWRAPAPAAAGFRDATILVPAEHDHHGRSALCVSCHSSFGTQSHAFDELGEAYQFRVPVLPDRALYDATGRPRDARHIAEELAQSRCLFESRLTCLTCHEAHGSQWLAALRFRPESDAPCLTCHAAQGVRISAHTRHAPSSPGSRCVNCHMPRRRISAAGAVQGRVHTIEIPLPDRIAETGFMNPCLQCHINQDAVWAARWRTRWWGSGDDHWRARWSEAQAKAESDPQVAAALLRGLLADKAQPPFIRASAAAALAARAQSETSEALYDALADENALVRFHTLIGLYRSNLMDRTEVINRATADSHPVIQRYGAGLAGRGAPIPGAGA